MPETPKSYENNNFYDHQENFCVLLRFQSFLCTKHFFLTTIIFIQSVLVKVFAL